MLGISVLVASTKVVLVENIAVVEAVVAAGVLTLVV